MWLRGLRAAGLCRRAGGQKAAAVAAQVCPSVAEVLVAGPRSDSSQTLWGRAEAIWGACLVLRWHILLDEGS